MEIACDGLYKERLIRGILILNIKKKGFLHLADG